MTLLGFTFGLLEMLIIGVFLLAMIISVSFDRRGEPAYKWVFALLGIGGVLFYTRDDWTIQTLADFCLSGAFWIPLLKYLGAGFLYSVIEFVRGVRIAKRDLSEAWERFLDLSVTDAVGISNIKIPRRDRDEDHEYHYNGSVRSLLSARDLDPTFSTLAADCRARFVTQTSCSDLLVKPISVNGQIDVKVNKPLVALSVGPWVVFWPFYLFSLIIGDLLAEVFATFADYLSTLGGKYVRMVFKDTFKL